VLDKTLVGANDGEDHRCNSTGKASARKNTAGGILGGVTLMLSWKKTLATWKVKRLTRLKPYWRFHPKNQAS